MGELIMGKKRETVRISVTGPVQTGKSIILARLKQVMEEEFGCTVATCAEVSQLATHALPQSLADWEKAMVKKNLWVLTEGTEEKNVLNLRAAFAKGFTTRESYGPNSDYKVVTKFQTLAEAQEAHTALIDVMALDPAGLRTEG